MSVREVTAWEVVCDEPGCGTTLGDLTDYACWVQRFAAWDSWLALGGIVLSDDRAYCSEHRQGKRCGECEAEADVRWTSEGDLCPTCRDELGATIEDAP